MGNEVRVDVALDTKKAEAEAKTFKGKLAAAFGDIGKIGGGILAAQLTGTAADAAIGTLKSSVGLARDYNEILSKSNTIFGDQAKAVEKWADSAATSFGQSKAEALDAAASFGNMFSQLGIGSDVTADMSKQMTELASDFASFHNADITQVIDAQAAAFRGEYDALQRFVPTINAAAVQQEALAMTGKTATKELTEQEKALAAYKLMLDGAGAASGDFERTSDSLSNQQRILSAQWKDLKTDLGQALIPALTELVTVLNEKVLPAVREFWEEHGPAIKQFFQDVKDGWENTVKPALIALWETWQKVDQIVLPIIEGIIEQVKLIADTIGDVVQLITAILEGDWKRAWEELKEIAMAPLNAVKALIETIAGAVKALAEDLRNIPKPDPTDFIPGVGIAKKGAGFVGSLVGGNIFDDGGVVPGPRGSAQLAVVHGGETILPTHKGGGVGGGLTINVHVAGSVIQGERDIKRAVRDALREGGFRGLAFGT